MAAADQLTPTSIKMLIVAWLLLYQVTADFSEYWAQASQRRDPRKVEEATGSPVNTDEDLESGIQGEGEKTSSFDGLDVSEKLRIRKAVRSDIDHLTRLHDDKVTSLYESKKLEDPVEKEKLLEQWRSVSESFIKSTKNLLET